MHPRSPLAFRRTAQTWWYWPTQRSGWTQRPRERRPSTSWHRAARPLRWSRARPTRPSCARLEALLRKANPQRRPQAAGRARQWVALASGGASLKVVELVHSVELSPEAFQAVLRSLSYLGPALGAARMAVLLADARTLAEQHGGARWERVLRLSWAKKR